MPLDLTPRSYTPDEHPMLADWWTRHQWPVIPANMLPAKGVIIGHHAAGFLYDDPTCQLAGIEWIVTNPDNSPQESYKAIIQLLAALKGLAIDHGKTGVFSTCKQYSLARTLEKSGMTRTDENMVHFLEIFTPSPA
jgi:hypothetical protein